MEPINLKREYLTARGETLSLEQYSDSVILIVNVASQCGFTPQYQELQSLFEKYQSEGFVVLAFPCNQFGGQEPAENQEIANFCSDRFNTTFPILSKIEVNGDNSDPLFVELKEKMKGLMNSKAIKWNFTKFLLGKGGIPHQRYSPQTSPASIEEDIKDLLNNR